jgi:hypothetical protein
MYSEKLEQLIEHTLADGVLTEKEKQVLIKTAEAEGVDLDEFEVVLDARLYEKTQLQAVNVVLDKQSQPCEQSNNVTDGSFKQNLLNAISSNPALWKAILYLGIAVLVIIAVVVLVLKMIMSWIVTMVICLGIFAVLLYAIRSSSKIFSSLKGGEDND